MKRRSFVMGKQKICASVLGLLILASICFAQAGKEKFHLCLLSCE